MNIKIISYVMIFLLISTCNICALDLNNNNSFCLPELPREIWKNEIVIKFLYPIEKATKGSELNAAMEEFLKFSLLSKKYNNIYKEIVEGIKIDGKKATLKEYYNNRLCDCIFFSGKNTLKYELYK